MRFLRAALAFGTLGGFALAVSLPVLAALGRMNLSWVAHAQVHGHLQVAGFAGLTIVGLTYHLAPRFGDGRPPLRWAVSATWWCLVCALLLRALGQPLASQPSFAVMLAGGALIELAGTAIFGCVTVWALRPAIRSGAPHALMMASGATWFAVQALLGAWWLTDLAREGRTVLDSSRNGTLVLLQTYGFILCVFLGVGYRSFPSFFAMPQPSRPIAIAAFLMLQAGLAGSAIARALSEDARGAAAAQILTGVGVLLAVSAFGWWRRETRFAVASQPIAVALRATLMWLSITGALLVWTGVRGLWSGAVPIAQIDGIRHIFLIGVVTLGITSMAQLILPEFASARLLRPPSRFRAASFATALSTAAFLRGVIPLAAVPDGIRFWSMAAAGLLGLGTVIAFSVIVVRAQRAHRTYLDRIARFGRNALPVVGLDR